MDVPRAVATSPFAGDRSGPLLVAHAAGNHPADLEAALAVASDLIEVDLWVHNGRFEARHERRVAGMPLLFEKWYLRFAPRHPFGLEDLIANVGGRAGLFLDLKNDGEGAATLIRRAIATAEVRPRIVASAQQWAILRAVARVVPEVDLFYSVDVQAKLDLFLAVEERDARPRGVSCNHELLTAERVRELKRRKLVVVAWTVDDPSRAAELASWGVDGITTNTPAAVRSVLPSTQ
ncbi:MAG TPA: glycerophosphodiester phosphodiesterase [Tepidiformaceae bacterium]|jgi:hypothetical protein